MPLADIEASARFVGGQLCLPPARVLWFGKLTRLGWLLALRDGYTT